MQRKEYYKIENARDSEIPVLGYNVCENMYIKGRGLSCMANDYQPPNPHPLNLNSPFELIVSSTHYDVFGILLDEFYLISLLLVWNSIFFHSLTFDGLWSIGLATFLLCLTQTSTYRQCQKTMRSKIELKYLTEGFRHILLFDNL